MNKLYHTIQYNTPGIQYNTVLLGYNTIQCILSDCLLGYITICRQRKNHCCGVKWNNRWHHNCGTSSDAHCHVMTSQPMMSVPSSVYKLYLSLCMYDWIKGMKNMKVKCHGSFKMIKFYTHIIIKKELVESHCDLTNSSWLNSLKTLVFLENKISKKKFHTYLKANMKIWK